MTFHIHNVANNVITTVVGSEALANFFSSHLAVTIGQAVVEGDVTFIRVIA